jgi:aminoglycoside phosphotransferase family enzyme
MGQIKMIKDLMNPSAYPEMSKNIVLAHTHISNVFIGNEFVYKIKKPVNFGFLDFSTLEKRKYYCKKEVELNNRFSIGVYLGVYPVTFNGTKYKTDGNGKIVDYAVKMKRLSDKNLMKSRFKNKTITSEDIIRIGKAIAAFHKISKNSEEINKFGHLNVIKFNTDENFEQTAEFVGNSITEKQFFALKDWTEKFYKKHNKIFIQRVKNGKIRDCHGDLHMEHIYLSDPIIIFDCIEFNDRFRYSDILSDIAFLLMDLEYNGGNKLAEKLCKAYFSNIEGENVTDIFNLINFYKVYRAYVRGKVTSFKLNDNTVSSDKKTEIKEIAQRYFTLAYSYILQY